LGSSPSGRYSAGGVRNTRIATHAGQRRCPWWRYAGPADPISQHHAEQTIARAAWPAVSAVPRTPKLEPRRQRGTTVIATSMLARIEAEIATATSEYS
jgi:hypothetical protein